jgi:branched-chain amino acid transport system ATP-binding protein
MSPPPVLDIRGLCKSFGGLQVTRNVSLQLHAGERVGLIGPNGAGKTTLINLITGVLSPNEGSVVWMGQDITFWPQDQRVRLGLTRTFQITQLAPRVPIGLQVELAIHQRLGSVNHMWSALSRYTHVRDEAVRILHALGLADMAHQAPLSLAYGQQRLVEMAIAMALQPRVLLLDEPMAGVPMAERQVVLQALDTLPKDLAILMIEHDMDLVFSFAHRMVVLAEGEVLAQGTPAFIRQHPAVRTAYLGEGG